MLRVSQSHHFLTGTTCTLLQEAKCNESLLEIAGYKFLGVPKQRCQLRKGDEIELLSEPTEVHDEQGKVLRIVFARHRQMDGVFHEGWIPLAAVETK